MAARESVAPGHRQTTVGARQTGAGGSTLAMEVDPDVRELRRKQTEMVQAMQSKKKGFKLDDVASLVLSMHSDLNATRDELQRSISMSDKQLSERLQDGVTKLSVFQQNLEANDRSIVDMHQKLTANDERLHQLAIQTAKDIEESLNNRIKALQDKMDQEMQHKANQLQELFETMDLTRRQLIAKEALLRNESRVLMHKNNELITGSLKASEKETREYLLSELHSTANRLSNVQATCEENTCDRMNKADRFANDLHGDLTLLMEKVAANHRALEDMVGHTSHEFTNRENRLRSDHGKQLSDLEARTNHLTNVIKEVENIPTRRVDWHIKDASAQLAKLAQKSDLVSTPPAWVSPIFEAAGAHDLQMELRFLRPTEVQADQDQDSMATRGDCVLALKGDPGLFVVCRLYVGTAFAQVEHTFGDDGQAVCTKPVCFIRDQINEKDGSLVVGFEVLEAIRRARKDASAKEEAAPERCSLGGEMLYHRYLNHRVLDILQDQVNLIRSGMVRRIEWRLEKASQLRKCFPENECLCSTTFEAAGVDDLQLVFYPSGYVGAREGFCSFFLHCPAGSMIKCWLSVGKHRREAKCAFEKPGFFGRTNFCRFNNSIDTTDDTTLLVLEIDEAQWNIEENLSHLPKVSTVSTKHNSSILDEDSMPPSPISQMFAAVALLSVFADATAPASIANLATNPANTDAHLKSVAGALTDLLKTNGANQASNTSDIVKTIRDLLEKNMKGHVIGNFNKSLAAMEASRNEFVKCRLTYEKSDPVRFPATSLLQANSTPWYEAYFQAYSQCKAGFSEGLHQNWQRGPLDCAPVSGEGYKASLDRMISDARSTCSADGFVSHAEDAKCKELGDQRTAWEEYDACASPDAVNGWKKLLKRGGENGEYRVENDYTKHPEVLALTIEPGVPEAKLSAFACHLARHGKTWEDEAAGPLPEKVDSKLSRQRLPGGKSLQETRQLPSIWTSIPKADVFEALEGYRTFNELKAPRRPMSTGGSRKGGVAWKDPHPQPPYSSRQPNPHRYLMYAS
eukprot:s1791_g10.t1